MDLRLVIHSTQGNNRYMQPFEACGDINQPSERPVMTTSNSQHVATYELIPLRGINLSGAEAGATANPTDPYDWVMSGIPTFDDTQYYVEHGMNTIRIPIKWSYFTNDPSATEPTQNGQIYLDKVLEGVSAMLAQGQHVIIDMHSYMRFSLEQLTGSGAIVSTDDMYNVWTLLSNQFHQLATQYKDQLMFEIANEPKNMDTHDVLALNNAGIAAVRDAGLENLVIIEGNYWSGLHSWMHTDNHELLTQENIIDPLDNYALAVHQYVDWNGSGTSPIGQSPSDFEQYINFDSFMQWARDNNMKLLLTEFGGGDEANAIANVNYLLDQIEANPYIEGQGGWLGWTAWVGGSTWAKDNFNYIGPNPDGTDNTLMDQVYENHLSPLDTLTQPVEQPIDQSTPTPVESTDDIPTTPMTPSEEEPITDSPQTVQSTYQFDWNYGARNQIQQFDVTTDTIDLSLFWTNYQNIEIFSDGNNNTVISLLDLNNHTITLVGINLNDLTKENIIGVQGAFSDAVLAHPKQVYLPNWHYGENHLIENFNTDYGIFNFQHFHGKHFSDLTLQMDVDGNAVIGLPFDNQTYTLIGISPNQLNAHHFEGLLGSFSDIQSNTILNPPIEPDAPVNEPSQEPTTPQPEAPNPEPTETQNETPTTPAQPDINDTPYTIVGTYDWNWGSTSTIANFDANTQAIDLQPFWTSFNHFSIYEDGEGNVIIDLEQLNNQTIILEKTALASLNSNNIIGVQGNFNDAIIHTPRKEYDFNWDYGKETIISDFNPDIGVIDLIAFNDKSFDDIDVYNDEEGNAVINLIFDQQKIVLENVTATKLNAANFEGLNGEYEYQFEVTASNDDGLL